MVWREGIVNQLFQMGIKGRMLHWIHDFFQDRTIQAKVGQPFPDPITRKTAHLKAAFWVHFTSLSWWIKTNKGSPAVDVCRRHRPLDHQFQTGWYYRMQNQLNETAKFLFANGFKISTSKSQAVLFRRNRMDANVKLSIGNELLSLSNIATFLSIVLDERLTWSAHAQTVVQRCLKRLMPWVICGSSWWASKSGPLQVYRDIIRSVMDYGCEAVDLGNERIKSVYYEDPGAGSCNLLEPALHHYRWSVEVLHTIFADRSSWRIMHSE